MKGSEIESILKYLSEGQMKTVKELEKLNDTEKRNLELGWHKQSPDSAFNKANKSVETLQNLNKKLGAIPELTKVLKRGEVINQGTVEVVKKSLEAKLKEVDTEFEAARSSDPRDDAGKAAKSTKLAAATASRRTLRDAQDEVKELDKHRKNIKPNVVADNSNSGEFTSKSD
jgi:hypothetical protein